MKRSFWLLSAMLLMAGQLSAQIDTEFWFAAPEVSISNANFDRPIVLRIATMAQASTVTVTQPANPGFVPITVNVGANATGNIDLTPWIDIIENKPPNAVLNYGLRITATAPVSVYYEIVSQQCLCNPEIFSLKGMNAVGNAFIVPFQTFLNNGGGYNPTPYSSFDIVATEDNTTITITPTRALVGRAAGVTFNITLNRGQTWSGTATSQAAAQHPSGTVVNADKPIAITMKDDLLSGAPYGGCADLMGDQIVPVNRVGEEYIVMKGGLNGPDRVFVVGTQNGTAITMAGAPVGNINAGQTLTLDINAAATYIEATAPVYVLHLSGFGCEVGGALLPPVICTGSEQLGFTRSTTENFAINLMTRTGNEGGFTINGNAGLVPAGAFNPVPGTNGDWMAAQIYFTPAQIAAGSGNVIANSLGKFHMGIIHGSGGGGTRYGYFSDFNAVDPPVVANALDVCEGQSIELTAQSVPGATFDWTGPNNFISTEQNPVIPDAAPIHQGTYTVIAEVVGCVSEPADIDVVVEDCACVETVTNGGFESPVVNGCWDVFPQSQVPEWRTSSSFSSFEIWNGACMGVPAYEGNQLAEMDASLAPYFMDVCTECAEIVNWGLAHRGRNGVDVMGLEAGPPGGPYVSLGTFTDGNTAWGYYTGTYTVPPGQDVTRFILTFISVSDGAQAMGNLVDAVTFVQAVIPIPVNALICEGDTYPLPGGTEVSLPGTYTDTLISSTGCDSVIVTTLGFYPQTVADAGADVAICIGQTAQLNGSGGVSYAWTPAASLNDAEVANPTATPTVTTEYTLHVTDANGCEDTDEVTVTVNPLPPVNTGADETICIGNTTQLNATGAATYVWNPATGLDNANISNPVFSGNATQGYLVTGTDANGCENTDSVTVTVVDLPPVSAGNDTSICIGETLQLNATGAVTYVWSPTDGLSNPNIGNPIFSDDATFTLTVTGTDAGGCVGSDDITITVHPLPIIDAGNDAEICAGPTVQLGASGAVTYEWSPTTGLNDGSIADPIFSGTSTTTFTVTGTDANGCSDTDDVTVTVNPLPVAVIDPIADVCLGAETELSHSSTDDIVSVEWIVSLGITSDEDAVAHTFTEDGTFPITLTVTDINGCVHSDGADANVLPLPAPDMNIADNDGFCRDEVIQFQAMNADGMAQYNWDFDHQDGVPPTAGFSSTDSSPQLSYADFGTYEVRLHVVSTGGCEGEAVRTLNVHDVPDANFAFSVACEGETTTLTSLSIVADGSTVNSWQWDLGDGSNPQTGATIQRLYAVAGTYTVTLIATTNQGCSDTIVQNVWVNPVPTISISGNDVCMEEETVFTNTSVPQDGTIASWTWDFGDTQTAQGAAASHTYSTHGTFNVTLTAVTDSGCTATGSTQVTVFPNPEPAFTIEVEEGCEPLLVPMADNSTIASGSIVSYTWDFGDGGTGSGAQVTRLYQDTVGTFDVTLTVTSNNGCITSLTLPAAVTVNVTPLARFEQNATVLEMPDALLILTDLSENALVYEWSFGDGDSSSVASPTHRYDDHGEFDIRLTVRNGDCIDIQRSLVRVRPLLTFYVPNAFTPNDDGVNEFFRPEGENFHSYVFQVFDRWGERVYEGTETDEGWDGTFGGSPAPQGIYAYRVLLTLWPGKAREYAGKVSLVR
jgi:gliding motility-associated-like protein